MAAEQRLALFFNARVCAAALSLHKTWSETRWPGFAKELAARQLPGADKLGRPYGLGLVARGAAEGRRPRGALAAVTEGLVTIEKSGERWWEPELHRLRGCFYVSAQRRGGPGIFETALRIARAQQAKSLELRAATSFARLWGEQGRRAEARDLLAPVYGWFTEGFDTPDLKEAKALLDELA